jgi:protein subunit release factor A
MEEEVDHFHEELEAQGERLAQAHAALAEVQMELEQAKGLLAERTEEGNRIRQMAAKRIRQLEEDLAKSQQQLKDLMAWVDRQRGRD